MCCSQMTQFFFSSGDDLKCLTDSIEKEMVNLKNWFDVNKLSLNLKKTKFMFFSKRKEDGNVFLTIDGSATERV